ncbi:hypothetical protein [Vibrio rotiferianus]|uniref:hypothetical protein n=1 Tax=Vibrio rotiferianus TaxID=190895 RepID=UPI00406A2D30
MFRALFLALILTGCASTGKSTNNTVTPKCDFSTFQSDLSKARTYIWGSPTHATFADSWRSISATKLKNDVRSLYKSSLEKANKKKQEYNMLEHNVANIVHETDIIIRNIDSGYCKAGVNVESYGYVKKINDGASVVLGLFPKYYDIIGKNIDRLESKEKQIQLEKKNKELKLTVELEREKSYRKYKGTTKKNASFLVQLEDFSEQGLYFSVKNISKSKIKKLFPKRCIEYDNELGGVSCIWKTNAYLVDNYGNKYDIYLSEKSKSLKTLKSGMGDYLLSTQDLYPDEKLYFKASNKKVIENTKLKMVFDRQFFGYESINPLNFPSKI